MIASLKHKSGGNVRSAIKAEIAADNSNLGTVEGYLVSWGNEKDTDLQGEYFSPRTEFCLDWFVERPVLYHHGLDGKSGLRKIGVIKSVEQDDLGLWVKAQLDLRDQYSRAVYDMVKTKEFGWSSGSVDHLVKIAPNGEIAVWPLIEGSITPTPAQPAKTTVRAMKNVPHGIELPNTSLQAFKSVVGDQADREMAEFLRELNARVGNDTESQNNGSGTKSFSLGSKAMSSPASKKLARVFARSFGVRATEEAINEVAEANAQIVESEVAKAAADELEEQAALAALEEELIVEETPVAKKNFGRRPVRSEDALDELAEKMADELEAELEETGSKRVNLRRAARRAVRNLESDLGASFVGDTEVVTGGVGDEGDYLGEQNEVKSFRRSNRRSVRGFARRSEEAAPSLDETLDDDLLAEVAAQSYRSGHLRGAQRAFSIAKKDGIGGVGPQIVEDNNEVGNYDLTPGGGAVTTPKSYRRPVRGYAQRSEEVVEEEETSKADPLEDAVEQALQEANKRLARKSGYKQGFRAGRAARSGELPEDEAVMSDDELEAAEDPSLRGYGMRRFRGKSAGTGASDVGYWKERAMKAESAEAPGQRNFGRVTRDAGDQEGAYSNAFKSYLYSGLSIMPEREKRVLLGKGQTDWKDTGGSFKAVAGASNRPAYKTYYGGIDSAGGFAVPPDWIAELNKNIMTNTVMAPECRTHNTTSDRIIQPSIKPTDARRAHRATARWVGEGNTTLGAGAVTSDEFSQIEVPIHIMLLEEFATNSMLEDATFSVEDHINESFSEAVSIAYDTLIWDGDGVMKMRGITTDSQVTSAASTGVSSVSGYVASGVADDILSADVIKDMYMHLPRQYRQKAKWYMNSDTANRLWKLKDGEGRYLLDDRDRGLYGVGTPQTLLDRPIVYNDWASDIEAGSFPIIFGDLSKGYIIGKRVDFSIRRFDDYYNAGLDRVSFIGRARLGGQVYRPEALKVLKIAAS